MDKYSAVLFAQLNTQVNNKACETIKYLSEENSELNHKLEQQINELEDKLTEYRLRFQYAEKQFTKPRK